MKIVYEHPIAPDVRARVDAELLRLEREHDVTILYACESGSRGWGFASPDSDYDVRFLYVHRLDWYLRVEPQRDVIECPISDELDISGWELRKALQLLHRSNPTLLEWLDSPVVYRADSAVTESLRALGLQCFSPPRGRYHYVSMAKKNYREHLLGDEVRLKKYFYVLRPLLAARWIDAGWGRPPMRFADLAERCLDDVELLADINALLAIKMRAGEAKTGPRRPVLNAFIEAELQRAERPVEHPLPHSAPAELDALLYQTVLARHTV